MKIFFKNEGKIKEFSEKRKWTEFFASISALYEMIKEVLQD